MEEKIIILNSLEITIKSNCIKCNKEKELSEFPLDKRRLLGVGSKCKECNRENYKINPNYKRVKSEIIKENLLKNNKICCIICKSIKDISFFYFRENSNSYRSECEECLKEYKKQHYEKDKENYKKRALDSYYKKNPIPEDGVARSLSLGERKIYLFLKQQNINFINEHFFEDCINIKTNYSLFFDFYLPNFNICIEFDGRQHFEQICFGQNDKDFKQRKERDEIKNQYCKSNNIKLIRIPYWDFNKIEEILTKDIK